MTTPVPPPAPPQAVIDMLTSQLSELVTANEAGFKALAARGIQFDPAQVLNGRIDMLIHSIAELIGPQGRAWALQALIAYEQQTAQNIKAGEQQGRQAQIATAAAFSPSEIRALARQTGTFGGR